MEKFDPVALTFIVEMVKAKTKMFETAAKLASDTDSNLYRSEVLQAINESCEYIDSMLAFNKTREEVE